MELKDEFDDLSVDIGQSASPTPVLERRAIVVAGSHRSGTSALARVLSLLGCDLPKHVMPPLYGNELGFWEPATVVDAHDVFLGSVGSSWDDVGALPDGAFVSAAARELRRQLALLLHEEYGASPLFVVKDPRISRLLPLWLAVLAELQIAPAIALAVRNPLEVAASLRARDGFTTTKSLLLWLRHTVEAEQHSRGRPRSIVLYDELLRDWQGVLARVGEDLAVTWPGRSHRATVQIEHFLSEQQRHHVFDWRDVEGRADVVSWVKEAYFALRASDSVQVLDQVRDELARADIAFGPILEEARLDLHASREQTLQGAAARDALGRDLEARNLELEARAAEVQQLQEQVGELNSALAASASQAATHQAEVVALHAEHDRLAHEVERLQNEAIQLAAALEAAHERMDAANAEARRLAIQLEDTSLDSQELAATADELLSIADRELEASRAERDRLQTEVADALEEHGQLLVLVENLEAALESAAAAVSEHQQAVATAVARESTALRAEFDTERIRLLSELEYARTDLENARSECELVQNELATLKSETASEQAVFRVERDGARTEHDGLVAELGSARTHAEELAAHNAELEAALGAHKALLHVLQSVTNRRTSRRRSLSQLGTWLLPPTPRKLNYLRRYLILRRSGEFDVDAYLLGNPDVLAAGINPLMHYVEYGVVEGRTAYARVSQSAGSAAAEPRDVEPSGLDQGKALQPPEEDQLNDNEGRRLRGQLSKGDVDVTLASDLFSPGQYRSQLTRAGIEAPAEDPAELARHYLLHGERAGFVPSLLFDPDWYAAKYPDVLRHRSLLLHFIEFGDLEHRSPHPLFDPAFYTRQAPDLIGRPYSHFRAQPDAISRAPHAMLDLRRFLDHRGWDAERLGIPSRRSSSASPTTRSWRTSFRDSITHAN